MEALDLVQRYWAVAFLAGSVSSILTAKDGASAAAKAKRVAAVVVLVAVSLRLERELSERLFTPALRWLLGDLEQRRAEVEREEAALAERLRGVARRREAAQEPQSQQQQQQTEPARVTVEQLS